MDAETESAIKGLLRRVAALEKLPQGKPGNGACICDSPPEVHQKRALELGYVDHSVVGKGFFSAWAQFGMNARLDHRCPRHGLNAQPAVWGRHKELQLTVTAKEWESLGIQYP